MMALVLRKAVLPKNVSFLKCLKGRPLATATNKTNAAPISSAVPCRRLRSRTQPLGIMNIEKGKHLVSFEKKRSRSKSVPVRICMSCPNLIPETRVRPYLRTRHFSLPRTRPLNDFAHLHTTCSAISPRNIIPAYSDLLQTRIFQTFSARAYSKPCGCPCPAPCGPYGCPGGCGCLPPPCNQPPRCLQYITGYYYYPYGTWFCGPYHVTGTCYPVSGSGSCYPCSPCLPCGPCPKCCPAPACVCPAAAAVMAPTAAPNSTPNQMPIHKPGQTMGSSMTNPINSPINNPFSIPKDPTQPRAGVSKFFPFNSATASAHSNVKTDPKPKRPYSFKTMSFWPYSTQATNASMKSNSTQSRPYSKLTYNHHCGQDTLPMWSDSCAKTEFNVKQKGKRSLIRHKRHRYNCNMCLQTDKSKFPLTSELWDRVNLCSGAYDNFSMPSRKGLGTKPYDDMKFKAYDL